MTEIISVRFRPGGKQYYFDPAGLTVPEGRSVIDRLYGSSLPNMVAALYDGRAIGEKDLEDLRRYLDELEGK